MVFDQQFWNYMFCHLKLMGFKIYKTNLFSCTVHTFEDIQLLVAVVLK